MSRNTALYLSGGNILDVVVDDSHEAVLQLLPVGLVLGPLVVQGLVKVIYQGPGLVVQGSEVLAGVSFHVL